jgi:hypothetical protein
MGEMGGCGIDRLDASVDGDRQPGARLLQPVDAVIIERWNVSVLLRREALQPSLSGVDHKGIDASPDDGLG